MPITTSAVSSNPTQAMQHYVMKCVSDLRQVCGFLQFSSPIKLTATINNWNIVESGIQHNKPNQI